MYINLNDKKTLILLTSEFPYGTGETFLENEFPFLTAQFDEILIFTENRKGLSRINSEKVQVNLLSSANWFNRIQSFFYTEFYKEIYHLSKNKKLNLFTFRTVWYSMSKAFVIANIIERWTQEKGCFFYSYWLDEKSISLALLKKNTLTSTLYREHMDGMFMRKGIQITIYLLEICCLNRLIPFIQFRKMQKNILIPPIYHRIAILK